MREDELRAEVAARVDDRELAARVVDVVGAGGGSACASSGSPSEKSWCFTEMMSAKSASASIASSTSSALGALVADGDALLHPRPDEAFSRDRDRVARQPVVVRVAEVEGRRKCSTRPEESRSGVAPPTVSTSRERKRVSCAKNPLVLAPMSPRSSEMQNVDPSRIVSTSLLSVAHDPAAARLLERLDHDLVDVHVQRPREGEQDAVGDLVGR